MGHVAPLPAPAWLGREVGDRIVCGSWSTQMCGFGPTWRVILVALAKPRSEEWAVSGLPRLARFMHDGLGLWRSAYPDPGVLVHSPKTRRHAVAQYERLERLTSVSRATKCGRRCQSNAGSSGGQLKHRAVAGFAAVVGPLLVRKLVESR